MQRFVLDGNTFSREEFLRPAEGFCRAAPKNLSNTNTLYSTRQEYPRSREAGRRTPPEQPLKPNKFSS